MQSGEKYSPKISNTLALVTNQVCHLTFGKRLAWLIEYTGLDNFMAHSTPYGLMISRDRFLRLLTKPALKPPANPMKGLIRFQKTNYYRKNFVSLTPHNLAAIRYGLDAAIVSFPVSYSLLIDGKQKEPVRSLPDGALDVFCRCDLFRARLAAMRTAIGHPYRGSFAGELKMNYHRYERIERGGNRAKEPLLKIYEYTDIQRVMMLPYSVIIEGKK